MPKYKYTARDEKGKKVRGEAEAANEGALQQKLHLENLLLLEAKSGEKGNKTKRIKTKALGEFCRELGTLLQAGVSLVRALAIVSEEEGTAPHLKNIYKNLLFQIRQGTPLSEAMEDQGEAFPTLLIEMVRSSEMSGTMDKTALRMADHYEKEYKLNAKVKNAMTYPMILGVLIVVVVVFLLTYVLPQFNDLFSQMPSLPLPTRLLYAIGDFLRENYLFLICLLLCLVTAYLVFSRAPKIRYQIDKLKLKLPVFGKLLMVIYTARFARSLSSLYSAGIPIVSALQICRRIVGNLYIDVQFDQVVAHVRGGGQLSEGLQKVDGFVKKLASSIMIGEETGSLDDMLDATAEALEYDSEMAVAKMTAMIEPIMIIVMAVIVGFILIAVITPIYNSYDSIEGRSY